MALEKDYSPQKSLGGGGIRPSQQEIENYHARRIGEVAHHIAKEMGHEGKINIKPSGERFQLNGREVIPAATYDLNNGEINLYHKDISDPSDVDMILPHEIGHYRYHVIKKLASNEHKAIKRNAQHNDAFMKSNWSPEMHNMYPHLSLMVRHTGDKGDKDKNNALDKSDGINKYTRDWWEAVKNGTAQRTNALDETHAEVTAVHHKALRDADAWHSHGLMKHLDREELADQIMQDVHGVHPSWRAFRKELHQTYQKHVENQRQNFRKTLAARGK